MIDKKLKYLKDKAPKEEFLAYINAEEAAMLKRAGGSGKLVNGIPSFRPQDMGNAANQASSAANPGAGGGSSNSSSSSNSNSSSNDNSNDAPKSSNKTSPMQDAQQERKSKEVGFDQTDRSNPYSEASKTAIDNFNKDIADRSTTNNTIPDLTNPLAPEKKGGFFNTGFGWTELGMAALYAFNPVLGAKIGKLKTAYNTAKLIGDTTGLYNAKEMKDNLLSQFSNPKGGTTDSNSENQWWASTLTGDNREGDNQEGDNQFYTVGAPEGIMKITEDMKIKKTAPTKNVNQQSMTFSPRYTRSNVANESEKGIANLKGMGESFADVFKTDTNIPVDGEGSSALLKEYAMLLKQMEQGLLQTEGKERLNILKSRLGLAQGGITNVNMNKGKLGEILYG